MLAVSVAEMFVFFIILKPAVNLVKIVEICTKDQEKKFVLFLPQVRVVNLEAIVEIYMKDQTNASIIRKKRMLQYVHFIILILGANMVPHVVIYMIELESKPPLVINKVITAEAEVEAQVGVMVAVVVIVDVVEDADVGVVVDEVEDAVDIHL